ncbi:unnamed protein product [Rotaria sordida]|uniref:Nuclear receptor domain-containing protein n=1 Tax=Rotaria sordida TaxID=392033 RepID=A0A814PHD1_9BILA|nr:unnamed protein product [Rotaria sordida]CAF0989943.1 unnamed protein product [Rotaria sordida]CAF1103446.1 unnamed protein product [Rotaria sordida]CAF1106180.1 unnamed protein product [Rotaria sordida]CAF1188459.1 unnamed protein product [Rotaria sordida]
MMMDYSRALCVVCGATAIGRNFDAYTCLSCKAFFRRNAYNEHIRYTCRVLNKCEITITTRRHCSACRLNKCFRQGMKKELIRSLTAIGRATSGMIISKHYHEQQLSRLTTMNCLPANNQSILLFDDWNLITNIRNAYEDYCIEPFLVSHKTIPLIITTQPYRSRIKIQRFIDLRQKYLNIIILFIKRVLQYNQFIENHYEYIKDNFRTLLSLNTSELMKLNILKYFPWEYDRFLFESILTENFIQCLEKHIYTYETFSPYDPLFTKLFLIVLVLTCGISPLFKKIQYNLNDFYSYPKEIFLTQNYYITLLWKYVIYRLGYYDSIMYSVRFIQHILRRQIIEADLVDIIQNRDDNGQLAQLMEKTMKI